MFCGYRWERSEPGGGLGREILMWIVNCGSIGADTRVDEVMMRLGVVLNRGLQYGERRP